MTGCLLHSGHSWLWNSCWWEDAVNRWDSWVNISHNHIWPDKRIYKVGHVRFLLLLKTKSEYVSKSSTWYSARWTSPVTSSESIKATFVWLNFIFLFYCFFSCESMLKWTRALNKNFFEKIIYVCDCAGSVSGRASHLTLTCHCTSICQEWAFAVKHSDQPEKLCAVQKALSKKLDYFFSTSSLNAN